MADLTKHDATIPSTEPVADSPPKHTGRKLLALIAAILLLTSLGVALFVYNHSAATTCGSPDSTEMVVAPPGGQPIAEGVTIDGDVGLLVTGEADVTLACTLYLLDESGSRYYFTTMVATTGPFQFVDNPIGGAGTTTSVTLRLIGANADCARSLENSRVWTGENNDSYTTTSLSNGCTLLKSFKVEAQRHAA